MSDFREVKRRIMKSWSWRIWLYYYWYIVKFRLFYYPKIRIRAKIKRSLGRFFAEYDDFIERCKDLYWDMEEW